jgi:hypothetical protein
MIKPTMITASEIVIGKNVVSGIPCISEPSEVTDSVEPSIILDNGGTHTKIV